MVPNSIFKERVFLVSINSNCELGFILTTDLSSKKRTAAKPYSPTFIASPLFIEPPI